MIDKEDILSLSFLKKQDFTGSCRGMRYRIRHAGEELQVTVWPQPLAYAASAPADRQTETFPYSEEGRLAAIDWLNRMYETQRERWDSAGFGAYLK